MKDTITREIKWGDQKLIIETGKVAKQATASTIVRYGDTVVMANVTAVTATITAVMASTTVITLIQIKRTKLSRY